MTILTSPMIAIVDYPFLTASEFHLACREFLKTQESLSIAGHRYVAGEWALKEVAAPFVSRHIGNRKVGGGIDGGGA